jgi:predicted permease
LAEVHVDLATVGFAIVIAALVAFACSIVPAMRIGRVQLSNALREGGRGGTAGRARQRVRSALVAGQIALALVALASSGLLLRTFQRLNEVRPGFEPRGVVTFWVSLPFSRYEKDSSVVRFYSQLLDRVKALPGVKDAGLTSRVPFETNGWSQDPLYPEDDLQSYANKIPPLNFYTTTDGAYFRTMGIPLLAGKTFDRLELQRPNEAIISRATAVQFWKDSTGQRVIGKRFRELPGSQWLTVVGVVGDTRDTSLAMPPSLVVYRPLAAGGDNNVRWTMGLVVRSGAEPAAITSAVQRAVRELDPTLPLFDVRTMTEVTSASMAQLSFTIIVLGAAALVTLILGAVGLYGVMAYVVSLRTRELAVRIALGATPSAVVRMLTKQGMAVTGFGIAGGLVLFVIVARALKSLLFGVASTDPVTLVSASLLLVGIAALASWLPARRTSRVDPADVLRAE